MRVLIACEFSGVVRRAFRALGHDAWSCDLLEAEDDWIQHLRGNCLDFLDRNWDLMIAHPPCTYLAVSGARWFKDRILEQKLALNFVENLMGAPIPRICIENPIGVISSRIAKPDQIIQPWQFGNGETKATCLWLKGLPKLEPTNIVEGRVARVHREPPGPDRWKNRSRTYEGIAKAMALQWGGDIRKEQAA
jgi:site-specific DNA-cytosine methylase